MLDHLREDSLGGDEFDGTFDLFTACYSLLHLAILSCVESILEARARRGDIYLRLACWMVFAPIAWRKRVRGLCEGGEGVFDGK